jgi:choline dehydrogenase-like flavoprotein
MIVVVGSGPAGVACAHALVTRGLDVTMLDVGIELEPDTQAMVGSLGRRPPEHWTAAERARISAPVWLVEGRVPAKASFGSDFVFRDASEALQLHARGVDLRPSFARGGLSNVWGAAVLPYIDAEIPEWPIGVGQLAPHYAAVSRLSALAAVRDRLADTFPIYGDEPHALSPSRQALAVMRHMEQRAAALALGGFQFGYSRLAVSDVGTAGSGCVQCGLCLHGCPYQLIYNSASTLSRLQTFPNFRYRGGLIVRRLTESADGVRIQAEPSGGGEAVRMTADRVCLAGGVLGSTRVLLESLDAFDRPVPIAYSQYFLVPALSIRAVRGVRSERLHTLAQLFLELKDPSSPHLSHMQLYGYNDYYAAAARTAGSGLLRFVPGGQSALLNRLLSIQGYLHSGVSPRLRASLSPPSPGQTPRFSLDAEPEPRTRPAIRRVVRTLTRHAGALGFIPLTPMLQVGSPGYGYHVGGSFPMRRTPGAFESDTLGRPTGFARVHVVDGSIFPTVPALPITYTIQANAHRIGSAIAN